GPGGVCEQPCLGRREPDGDRHRRRRRDVCDQGSEVRRHFRTDRLRPPGDRQPPARTRYRLPRAVQPAAEPIGQVVTSNHVLSLIAITLFAAIVNGGLGYGFSSITVPLALLFLSNRVLNPALVLIEVALNAYVLWVNRDALGSIWRRMLPIVIGLAPGVILGTLIVSRVSPAWLKLWTYIVLLPLILLQAAGYRRPIRAERAIGLPFGFGIGVLYSVTTISGPPLAVMLNNQGLAKREFRAALGFIRLAESTFTAIAYFTAGLITTQSMTLIPQILPSVLIG